MFPPDWFGKRVKMKRTRQIGLIVDIVGFTQSGFKYKIQVYTHNEPEWFYRGDFEYVSADTALTQADKPE